MALPGRYKGRRPRRPRGTGGRCRACGLPRTRDEAAAATALGRPGLCLACLATVSAPIVRPKLTP